MSNDNRGSGVRTLQSESESEQSNFMLRASQIWLLFAGLEILIALRIGLKMVGANPDNTMVALIYGLTSLFLMPFVGLIGSPTLGGTVLEISSMFAMLIYALVEWAMAKAVWLIFYRPRGPIVGMTETATSEHHTIP